MTPDQDAEILRRKASRQTIVEIADALGLPVMAVLCRWHRLRVALPPPVRKPTFPRSTVQASYEPKFSREDVAAAFEIDGTSASASRALGCSATTAARYADRYGIARRRR